MHINFNHNRTRKTLNEWMHDGVMGKNRHIQP